MKIYLFLNDKIKKYSLPNDIDGSYNFYHDYSSDSTLINVEARDGKWIIYSTVDSVVLNGNTPISNFELINNTYYMLRWNNNYYLIYVVDFFKNGLLTYTYDKTIDLIIGDTSECNIVYSCGFFKKDTIRINYDGDTLWLNKLDLSNNLIYLNDRPVLEKIKINYGDKINIGGLRIIVLPKLLVINNIGDNLKINNINARIEMYTLPNSDKNQNLEIRDVDLYDERSYFSKSPRIRRIIETKEIKLSPPPSKESNQELPLILTIGPMLTMGATSAVMLIDTLNKINTKRTTWSDSWSSVVSASAMLISMLMWPLITNYYNKYQKKKRRKDLIVKYSKYLDDKRIELKNESILQREILIENLISVRECYSIIVDKKVNFWDKRVDQSDFLIVRIGIGDALLDAKVEYPDGGFSIEEDELKKQADKMVEEFKYIKGVPISYSLLDNRITAIMGNNREKSLSFVDNILVQLLAYYSYEDLKIVIFTNENNESHWEYLKYLNHTFNNEKNFRFFSNSIDDGKNISEYLNMIVKNRELESHSNKENDNPKPHYLIITDDYTMIKKYEFLKTIEESDDNLGFSIIIIEDRLSKLPSKCNNFISLGQVTSGVMKNSYEKQEQIKFTDEVVYDINMMEISKILSNVPIEFEDGLFSLPNTISFMEMEHVGKVEQLNILNRWQTNDATNTLRAEIGIGEDGERMYLDLHEKYHGPHGLIAGTTGSGKSEFIITYILSMCINYSPNDVAFILIDYKGGGLALAFENKATGISLPHLAGTITNLDKADMDRTLVSIDSEVKRRQRMFNEARDKLEESTIDIYKYQKFYNEGKLEEPIPHLFIICDEFAELKSQQPDFMDNLISVARIGRSLGVHLILATQKPSGVVNDQIWSNTKFRVCLKVQDEADSKEMLKRPEAAHITQAGRYYLQVGYDEVFALGQSGWCGAKYFPSDTIVKQVDKSVNFIDNCGLFIKSIQASSGQKVQAQGEQLQAIMKSIIDISNKVGIKARKLWLDNIPSVILVDDLEKKYNIIKENYNVSAILGEYDAPEKQEQGLVNYNYLDDGNTIIYGNDGSERELFLETLIYSTVKNYLSEEVNLYIVDYGSESLRRYQILPQVGGMVFLGEDEKFNNLLKMIKDEIRYRKDLFINYGGEYKNYIKNANNKLPLKVIIFNNFDSIYETFQDLYDTLPELVRDSERYGIIFILSCNAINSISNKTSQNFSNLYTFKLKDSSDYSSVFNMRTKIEPRDSFGRGLLNNDGVHEFQTANIVGDIDDLNDYLTEFISNQKQINKTVAKKIPVLPDIVKYNDIKSEINDLTNIPIGISKNTLDIITYDFTLSIGNIISSNKLINCENFIRSLLEIFKNISNNNLIIIDSMKNLMLDTNIYQNYYNNEFVIILDKLIEYVDKLMESNTELSGIILIYGLNKFVDKLDDISKFEELLAKLKKYEKISIIIVEDTNKIKTFQYESWFSSNFGLNDGIWIGRGISDSLFRLSTITREMTKDIKNDMGYYISESMGTLVKLLDFVTKDSGDDNNG